MDEYAEEKKTENNLIVRSGIYEAETSKNKKKLRSTFCIEAIQTRSIARPLCDSRACCTVIGAMLIVNTCCLTYDKHVLCNSELFVYDCVLIMAFINHNLYDSCWWLFLMLICKEDWLRCAVFLWRIEKFGQLADTTTNSLTFPVLPYSPPPLLKSI